jgi:hypothetical protein
MDKSEVDIGTPPTGGAAENSELLNVIPVGPLNPSAVDP